MISPSRIKQALLLHYSAPPRQILRRFRDGVVLFAAGLMVVILANSSLPPSAGQEALILLGMVVGGCGFSLALLAEIRFVIGRFIRFFRQ